ncbi:protoporphyrinogen oxidase, partial [bacterium]|nr:protoporphyrinogen oxidase [bacterium]
LTPSDVISPSPARTHQTRFVISPSGRPAALTGPLSLLRSGVLNFRELVRALLEIFVRPKFPPDNHETLYQFAARRFGRAVAENLMLPMATGIWGGGAESLLARHAFPVLPEMEIKHGSVVRGLLAKALTRKKQLPPSPSAQASQQWPKGLLSFPNGMQTLVEAFQENLNRWGKENQDCLEILQGQPVVSIESATNNRIRVNAAHEFDAVFWTAVPWKSQSLQWDIPEAAADWQRWFATPQHSLVVVNVAGRKSSRTQNGFGVLARRESTALLGVLFVHSIYPQHVPEGFYSYRVLIGGDRRPEAIGWSDEELRKYTLAELNRLELLDEHQEPADIQIVRWQNVVGIADCNHDERLKSLWRIQARYPGLYFAGIYKKGVGVADALQSAADAVQEWKMRETTLNQGKGA